MAETTVVHLLRHGEVHNPGGILYGRLPGYHLSETGRQMAELVAKAIAERDVVLLASSPMERAKETAAPISERFGLEVKIDDRLTEADNVFQGKVLGVGRGVLGSPAHYRHLWNPFRPSWGERYVDVMRRMKTVIDETRETARGHEAVLVTHQLPIWIIRMAAERRRLWHDPRRRQCTVASLTSFTFDGDRLVSIGYSEPAGALLKGPEPTPGA